MELRKVLFGYSKDHNGFHINRTEADTVTTIFSSYLSGNSMNKIAGDLTEQSITYYKERNIWNKNMVKRILENPNYCGNNEYPNIISKDSFNKVQILKSKNCSYKKETVLPEIEFLKKRVFCDTCGGEIYRQKQKNGKFRWLCHHRCKYQIRIYDEDLRSVLKICISKVKDEPSLLNVTSNETDTGYMPSLTVKKNEKELEYFLEQGNLSFSNAVKILLSGISEKYKCCRFIPGHAYTDELNKKIQDLNVNEFDTYILETIIEKVIVKESGDIVIVFRNKTEWCRRRD